MLPVSFKLLLSGVTATVQRRSSGAQTLCSCGRSYATAKTSPSKKASMAPGTQDQDLIQPEATPKAKAKKAPKAIAAKFATGDEDLNELIQKHRLILTHRRASPAEMYIINNNLAGKIADLMAISPKEDGVILEANPGLGLLTKKILDRGARKLRVLEGREAFLYRFEALQKEYGSDRLEVVCPFNVIDFRQRRRKKIESAETATETPIETAAPLKFEARLEKSVATGLPVRDWSAEFPGVKFFGIVVERSEMEFLRRILYSIIYQNVFCTLGRPEFYLVLSPRQSSALAAQGGEKGKTRFYRWTTVAFQSFFDIATLCEVPRVDLVPPPSIKHEKAGEMWHLVQLTARRNLPQVMDFSVMAEFLFFLKQALISRLKPFMQWIEGWIPGYGLRLLDKGYTLYVKTGELTPKQYLELFSEIVVSPEYASSNLKIAFQQTSHARLLDDELEELEDEEADETDALAKL